MIRAAFLLMITTAPGYAQSISTDAFGVLPTSELGERAYWSGYRENSEVGPVFQPAGTADAAILFVGPKSIVAGAEPGHAVALALDVHGNMLDGANTEFSLGFGETIKEASAFGIADYLFQPPPSARVYLAGSSVSGTQSSRSDYRVTADLASVAIQPILNTDSILQESFGILKTEQLFDAYGNLVEDGVGLNVILNQTDGSRSFLTSVVRDGASRSTLLSRDLSGQVAGSFSLAGEETEGIRLTVDKIRISDLGDVLIWAQPSINATELRIGPIQTKHGYVVPDGTSVQIEIAGSLENLEVSEGWALDGYVSFLLALSPENSPFEVTIRISDYVSTAEVAVSETPIDLNVRGAE